MSYYTVNNTAKRRKLAKKQTEQQALVVARSVGENVIGVDEVGRGAWAGPLLVCAARLKPGKQHVSGLTDSKKLTKNQREQLYPQIVLSYDIGEAWVAADVIDRMGLSGAMKTACTLAVTKIDAGSDEQIILDGTTNFFDNTMYTRVETMTKADSSVPEVSAAAIAAKVMRDALMADYEDDYPGFGFAKHVGYGTAQHKKELETNGITLIHRKSFKPIKDLGW